eukprot:s1219_g9.t1
MDELRDVQQIQAAYGAFAAPVQLKNMEQFWVPVFNAVWTVMAVMDVARLPKFQVQLAPDCSTPTQVLNHVLSNSPKVLPSFVRMPQEAQALARDCLVSEFVFAEFIWAEIPPARIQFRISELL